MALTAKMAATTVTKSGGGRWVPCAADHPDARDVSQVASIYGIPPWFGDTMHVRFDPVAQAQEYIKLTAVSSEKDENDPNREWAMASPSGHLELHIANPGAFGYVDQGYEYRVTIERIRGPRERTVQDDLAEQPVTKAKLLESAADPRVEREPFTPAATTRSA